MSVICPCPRHITWTLSDDNHMSRTHAGRGHWTMSQNFRVRYICRGHRKCTTLPMGAKFTGIHLFVILAKNMVVLNLPLLIMVIVILTCRSIVEESIDIRRSWRRWQKKIHSMKVYVR